MLDQTLAAVRLPEDDGLPWRDRLKAIFGSYCQILVSRRGMAQPAMSAISTGPDSLRIGDEIAGLLRQGGAGDVEAVLGSDLLRMHVTAVVAEKGLWQANGDSVDRVRDSLLAIRPEDFPSMVAARNAFLTADPLERLNRAVDVTIDGIVAGRPLAARPAPPRAGRRKPS